jgi:2,3-bisphosphoglycerate-dependent phosphoglycerate mutase
MGREQPADRRLMATIYFIRHAEPDYRIHNDMERPLTEEGKRSCSKVTEYLMDKKITKLFSSPYKRAIDTVQDFAKVSGLTIEAVCDLRERAVEEGWIENFSEFVHNQWKDFDYKLKGGESLREVEARCIPALEAILREKPEENIVIGSHGTAISTIIHYYDQAYGVEHFNLIRSIMPFVAKLKFDHTDCKSIEILNIMGNNEQKIYEKIV